MAPRSFSVLNRLVVSDGATLTSVSQFSVNRRYDTSAVLFPDRDDAKAAMLFPVPADYVSTPEFDVVLGAIGQNNTVRMRLEYNVVAEFQTYDPASADEQLNQNEGEGSNALRIRVATFTPATPANFVAGALCFLNVLRRGEQAGDTSSAPVMLLDVVFRYSDA